MALRRGPAQASTLPRGVPMIKFGLPFVVATLLLVGCAAGQRAHTAAEIPTIDGVNGQSGSIAIRNAAIAAPPASSGYPSGASVGLVLTIANTGGTDDTLQSVSSPGAKGSALSAQPSGSAVPSESPLTSQSPSSGSATGSESASATPSLTETPSGAPTFSAPIPVPAGEAVRVGYTATDASITLSGISSALTASQSLPVTFTFLSGNSISLMLPVKIIIGQTGAPVISPSGAG
jgi:copper(I)-binding protein